MPLCCFHSQFFSDMYYMLVDVGEKKFTLFIFTENVDGRWTGEVNEINTDANFRD